MSEPIHWGSYPGEFLEKVMGVLVAQDHPDAIRRTPSSGDGGVDLIVPVADGVEVHQVKGFTGRVKQPQRQQIEKSWNAVSNDPRVSQPIVKYRLVVPIDPTSGEQAWFEELTAASTWEPTWDGLLHWESLASRHPHVIDYFMRGGQERTRTRARTLQAGFVDPTQPVTAVDAAGHLTMIGAALNRDDPHYRYAIEISQTVPTRDDHDGCVFTDTRALVDGDYLTIRVIPRHKYSLTDEPITGSVTINIPDVAEAKDFAEQWWAFEQFGRALDIPNGFMAVEISAPGGLGGEFTHAGGWIRPLPIPGELPPLRAAIVDPDDTDVLLLDVTITAATTGIAGGHELQFQDEHQTLTGTLQLSPPDKNNKSSVKCKVKVGNIVGLPINHALPAVNWLDAVRPPNRIRLYPEHGNMVVAESGPVQQAVKHFHPQVVTHLNDLFCLQQYAPMVVTVPEKINPELANSLRQIVRILEGETVTGTWESIVVRLHPGRTLDTLPFDPHEPRPFALESNMTVIYENEPVTLGKRTTILAAAILSTNQPADLGTVRIVPLADNRYTERSGALVTEARGHTTSNGEA